MAHDVFISYGSQDKSVADAACAVLEAKRIRCWIAPRDILPGLPFAEAITDAITESKLLVLVFSSHSNRSHQVSREVEAAIAAGITVIPLRIENVQPSKSMTYFIKSVHWLDALTPPLEQHLHKLAETVKLLLDRLEPTGSDTTNAPYPESVPSVPAQLLTLTPQVRRRTWLVFVVSSLVVGFLVVGVWWLTHRSDRDKLPEFTPQSAKELRETLAQTNAELKAVRQELAALQIHSQETNDRIARFIRDSELPKGKDAAKVAEMKQEKEDTEKAVAGIVKEVQAIDVKIQSLYRKKFDLQKQVMQLSRLRTAIATNIIPLGEDQTATTKISQLDDLLKELSAEDIEFDQELEILKAQRSGLTELYHKFQGIVDHGIKAGFTNNYS